MTHHTSSSFWACYESLSRDLQDQADKNFALLKTNPRHPSLHFKRIGKYWSVRASLEYRALGIDCNDGILWFWLGTHSAYDRLIAQQRKR